MAVGPQQLLILLLVALLLFGSNRLSEVGKGLGEGIRNFKKGLNGDPGEEKEKKLVEKPKSESDSDSKRLPPNVIKASGSEGVDRAKQENA